jgi:hypothetical protein
VPGFGESCSPLLLFYSILPLLALFASTTSPQAVVDDPLAVSVVGFEKECRDLEFTANVVRAVQLR